MSLQSIGISGLIANRIALDTTGHNISNVNTEGYSRQRVDFVTRDPFYTPVGYIGTGVESSAVKRSYNDFVAGQMRASSSVASELEAYFQGASQLDELVANADSGLQPTIQNFFSALQGLADDHHFGGGPPAGDDRSGIDGGSIPLFQHPVRGHASAAQQQHQLPGQRDQPPGAGDRGDQCRHPALLR
ncbi:MAG: flagellar basal body protein [Candidatus Thiodiazotropha sp.]